ncbi:HlyD family secretion protein [Aeromonas enteropelogenes]|uniref:HlyD family secretion protein n=1 Tax=Aeromonas enteropelogenes TaxID=29489 RepID=UPI0005A806BA|nr:HlyD family secretion protein [Aeromonas enteropelogenes]UBH53933.1 HlyD family secretion protein [Aeromonas enteropelogenes]
MSQDPQPSQPTPSAPPAPAGKGSRVATQLLLALIGLSLLWYFAADRLTPYSSQARVQAFVVPIAAQVSGQVQQVLVKNNDDVAQGQPLFEIDPSQYQIALQRARSDYDSVLRSVNAASAGVTAAEASLQAAKANRLKAEQDANRQERLYAEDPGAISVRRLEVARATRVQAQSQVKAAEASLIQAKEAAGNSGDKNSQLMSARSAIEKAELDLAHTRVLAPSRGLVTDLRTDVGQFVSAGAPAMTLIAIHDVWISADMTENNLGNLKQGDEVAIVLDVMPGQVFKGRIRSLGNGVSAGNQTAAGSLPTVQNNRDWLRQAQRFPVAIEFDKEELARLQGIRVGGQAEVLVYSGDNWLMNGLGALFIRLMSLLSYLY